MARATRASAARANALIAKPQQLSSPPATPLPGGTKSRKKSASIKKEAATASQATPANSGRKRARVHIKQEEGDVNELPHNLATALPTPGADADDDAASAPSSKRARRSVKKNEADVVKKDEAEVKKEDEHEQAAETTSPKKTAKRKDNYGLTPGVTPYPDYPRPTPEECQEVVRLLEKVHGKVVVPKEIQPPSLDVAGCGEVPSVLDALVRTRLSANTTNKNSSTAFQGLVARFGTLKEGIGKGSVDWDAVRRAPQKEVFKSHREGRPRRQKIKGHPSHPPDSLRRKPRA